MSNTQEMEVDDICFGVSRHNVIIPLKVVEAIDYKDSSYKYRFALNHPKPTEYMETHYEADFKIKFTSEDSPLCDKFTQIRKTIKEARELAKVRLLHEKQQALMKINGIDKSHAKIDAEAAEMLALITAA